MLFRSLAWDSLEKKAKAHVKGEYEKSLNYKPSTNNDYLEEYYTLVKAILECEQPPEDYLQGYSTLLNWQSTSDFLHGLHHSCVDDGGLSFVSCKDYKVKLVLACPSDYWEDGNPNYGEDYIYYNIAYPHAKASEERIKSMKEQAGAKVVTTEKNWEIHSDYKRFVKELKEFPAKRVERVKVLQEKRELMLGRLKTLNKEK